MFVDNFGRKIQENPNKNPDLGQFRTDFDSKSRASYPDSSISRSAHLQRETYLMKNDYTFCDLTPDSGIWCEEVNPVPKITKQRYYFDSITQTCECFKYNGCDGNANNFENGSECVEQCGGHINPIKCQYFP